MPPAAIVGGAALLGAAPGVISAVTGAGKSRYNSSNFSTTPEYNENKFNYGGKPYVADAMASRYAGADAGYGAKAQDMYSQGVGAYGHAYDAFDRAASEAQMGLGARDLGLQSRNLNLESRGLGLESRGLGLESRGRQGAAQNLMMNRALGRDLVSDREAALGRNDLSARLRSGVASARGPAALANAQSDAMAAEAQGLGQINSNANIAAIKEQQGAEQAAFDAASGMRQSDLGTTQNDLGIRQGDANLQGADANMRAGDSEARGLSIQQGTAIGNMGANMQQAGAQYGNLGATYAGLENQVRSGQLQGGIANQQTLAGSHNQGQAIDSGISVGNAQQDVKNIEMIAGGVAGGAQTGLTAGSVGGFANGGGVPKRAHGGPVAGGGAYLVGERGPELIVPKKDGYVVPNHVLELSRRADAIMAQLAALKAEGPAVRRLSSGTPESNYDTELTSGAEQAYQRKYGSEGTEDYDLRGAFAEGLTDGQPLTFEEEDGRLIPIFPGHLPDTYKKPSHETFSVESQYADYAPERAGSWDGERYIPPTDLTIVKREDGGPVQAGGPDDWDPDGARAMAAKGLALASFTHPLGAAGSIYQAVLTRLKARQAAQAAQQEPVKPAALPPVTASIAGVTPASPHAREPNQPASPVYRELQIDGPESTPNAILTKPMPTLAIVTRGGK